MNDEDNLSPEMQLLLRMVRDSAPGINVEADEYCIGYWARFVGFGEPATDESKRGWWQRASEENENPK